MLLALLREGCDVGSLGKSFCAPQTWKMVMFVYMGRFVNNLHCREDVWREDFLTYLIGKSFCLPFLWRLSGRNFYYILPSVGGLRQAETLPHGQISENFSPMIIGLNASIFTPAFLASTQCNGYDFYLGLVWFFAAFESARKNSHRALPCFSSCTSSKAQCNKRPHDFLLMKNVKLPCSNLIPKLNVSKSITRQWFFTISMYSSKMTFTTTM